MMVTTVTNDERDAVKVVEAGEAGVDAEQIVELLRRTLVQLQPGPETLADDWPNLTMQQLRVMRILYAEGATRVSVLARRLNVSTPTVTGILDRLVRQGLTYRADDPRDRRVVLNALTEQGVAAIEQLFPMQIERLSGAVAQLDDAERDALAVGLNRLLGGLSGDA